MRFQLRTLEWSLVPKPLLSTPFWRIPAQVYARSGFNVIKLLFCGEYIYSEVLRGCNDMNIWHQETTFCVSVLWENPIPIGSFDKVKPVCQLHILWIRQLDEKLEALPISRSCQGRRAICGMVQFFTEIVSNNRQKKNSVRNWLEGLTQVTCILWNALELRDLLIHSLKIPSKQSWYSVFVSRRTLELPFSTPSRVGSVGESFTTTCPCTGGMPL